jgi:hypothetical protein
LAPRRRSSSCPRFRSPHRRHLRSPPLIPTEKLGKCRVCCAYLFGILYPFSKMESHCLRRFENPRHISCHVGAGRQRLFFLYRLLTLTRGPNTIFMKWNLLPSIIIFESIKQHI